MVDPRRVSIEERKQVSLAARSCALSVERRVAVVVASVEPAELDRKDSVDSERGAIDQDSVDLGRTDQKMQPGYRLTREMFD